MLAVSVVLPGPALAGTLPSQPTLGQDPSKTGTDKASDVLSGVPGIVGMIETDVTGATQPSPLQVALDWVLDDGNGNPVTIPNNPVSALSIVPPVIFADLGESPVFNMTIQVQGTISVPDPANPGKPLASALLPLLTATVPLQGIPIPRLLGLFTWPLYEARPAAGRSNPNQNSLLVMLPANSPLTSAASITSAIQCVQQAAGPIVTLLNGPLPAGTVTDFAPPVTVVPQLSALLSGLTSLASALAQAACAAAGYMPVMIAKASAPSPNSQTGGGLSDITSYWWHSYAADTGHDYYHDNAQSFLWLAPPTSQAIIYRDTNFSWGGKGGDVNNHGRMTLTTGGTCLAGIADFRPHPSTIDTNLSPSLSGLPPGGAVLDGYFTNEHPPTSESNWAWTDSIEFPLGEGFRRVTGWARWRTRGRSATHQHS
jgi:hypothetical protein